MTSTVQELVSQIVGTSCEVAENPYGSILSIDFGPLGLGPDDSADARMHGWRHLTVSSPWRVQDDHEILFDWNVDGGANGLLPRLLSLLVGQTVVSAFTKPPAWDLVLRFAGGFQLVVFGDRDDNRDDAWFILGTDGAKATARPVVRPLPVP